MATLTKTDYADRVTYTSDTAPDVVVTVYKEDHLHVTFTATWTVTTHTSWSDYVASLEQGHTIV